MASSSTTTRAAWGKANKGFAEYLNIAGQTIGREAAKKLADAAEEFLLNEDWDWPRGKRYDAYYKGRDVRGADTYASGFRGGDAMHPWYSGNLHDSLAVGVIQGTRILALRQMSPGATSEQDFNGKEVDGFSAGREAFERAAHTFAVGQSGDTLRAVMVIGVPYADYLNTESNIGWNKNTPNSHLGYADYLGGEFYSTIRPKIESLRKIKLKL